MTTEMKIHVGDVDTEIIIEMDEDLSAISDAEFHVQKPDGTEVVWTADVGSAQLSYVVGSGDLDMAGRWIIQPYVKFTGSLAWEGHGDSVEFEVYPEYSLD